MLRQLLLCTLACFIASLSHAAGNKIVVPNTKDFNKQVSSMNACYLSSKTDCNGVDMSQYYWSNDPATYWKDVNKSLDSSNPWSSSGTTQASTPAPVPVVQNTTPVSAPPLPVQESTGILMTNNDSQTPPANDGGFIIG